MTHSTASGRTRLFRDIVKAETIKAATLPSTAVTVALALLAGPLVAAVLAQGTTPLQPPNPTRLTEAGLGPVTYVQVGFEILGVLIASNDYDGGQIGATLLAVPQRLALITGRTTAFLAITMAAALVTISASLTAAAITVAGVHVLFHPTVMTDAIGAVAYLVLIGLVGFSAGLIARSTTGASIAMLVLLAVANVIQHTTRFAVMLPSNAATQMIFDAPVGASHPGRAWSYAIVSLWGIVAWCSATALFIHRDA